MLAAQQPRIVSLGFRIAEHALDPQCEPKHIGPGIFLASKLKRMNARLGQLALLQQQARQPVAGSHIVRLKAQCALIVSTRILVPPPPFSEQIPAAISVLTGIW